MTEVFINLKSKIKKIEIEKKYRIKDLMKDLNLIPQEFIVIDIENDKLLTSDKRLHNFKKIEIKAISSRG